MNRDVHTQVEARSRPMVREIAVPSLASAYEVAIVRDGAQTMRTMVDLRIKGATIPFNLTSLDQVSRLLAENVPINWHTVITPNLHHIYLLRRDPALLEIYRETEILLPDGWPVASVLSRIAGRRIERVAGSDILERLLESPGRQRPLVLVGGRGAEELAVIRARAEAREWKVFTEPASFREVEDVHSRRNLMARIAESGSGGVVILGLGAPKQERFANELKAHAGAGFILCLGMAINFSAGAVQRAPRWVQKCNIEWIHRISQEPARLFPRYARDTQALIPLVIDNYRGFA